MFRYRLRTAGGEDIGEAPYPSMVKEDELLFFGGGRKFRVVDVVPFEEEDESPFADCAQSVER